MHGYIYRTLNIVNNKYYIGKRNGEFTPNYFGSGIVLKKAIDKYGRDKFKLEVIIYAEDKQKLCELEKQYIKEYREKFGINNLYNITDGGEGHTANHTEKTKQKISLAKTGKRRAPFTEETKMKMRLNHVGTKGKKLSAETIRKMKKPKSEEFKNKLRGRKLSNEHKEKLRLAKIGINNPWLGKRHSEETKVKMAISAKRGWDSRKSKVIKGD